MRLRSVLYFCLFLLSWPTISLANIIDNAQRVQFAAGANSAIISGQATAKQANHHLLRANAGQLMVAQLHTDSIFAFVSVFQVVSGQVQEIITDTAASSLWAGILPQDGDYLVTVLNADENPIEYELELSIHNAPTTGQKELTARTLGSLANMTNIEGDYILNRQANLNILKVFGNRIFVRITGLGKSTCNFTGSGILENNKVEIYNQVIGEQVHFIFQPDTIEVQGSVNTRVFCAGNASILGRYVREHLLPPVVVAQPTPQPAPQPTAQPVVQNIIDILSYRCSSFNRDVATVQNIIYYWMNGFAHARYAIDTLKLNLAKANTDKILAELTQACTTDPTAFVIQVYDDIAQRLRAAEDGRAFIEKLFDNIIKTLEGRADIIVDMRNHNCAAFRKENTAHQHMIMAWILGYGQGRMREFDSIPVDFSQHFLDQNLQVLSKYCVNNQDVTVINAADNLSKRN